MRREDIDKAAVDSCVIENSIFNPELTPYYEQGFKDGANWRINSVWHEMCEKPDFSKLPILLQHKNGKIHLLMIYLHLGFIFKSITQDGHTSKT